MPTANYVILVDWDGDGSFEVVFITPRQPGVVSEDEDVSQYIRAYPGIDAVRGKDQIRALAPPMAGRCDVELDNQGRQFSPENSGSPLYGNLIPGRQIQVQALYDGTPYYLWTGYLDDIPQYPAKDRLAVSLPSLGPLAKLAGKKISTALYQNITTDVALGHLLDAADWPTAKRVLDTGKTTLEWWWLQEEDALQAALTLLNTEGPGAVLLETEEGDIEFQSRHYRYTTTRATSSQATFRDSGTEPRFAAPFSYNPGLKDIINAAELTTKKREAAASYSAIWSLGQTVTLSPGETRKYGATSSDPFTDAQTPVDATDYTVTSGSLSTVSLNRTSGQSVTITLTAGASGATVTGLQLRAKAVTVTNTTGVQNTIDTSTSITRYGRQVYTAAVRSEIALNAAQDLVNAIVSRYQEPRPTVTLSVNNETADRMTQILSRDISDRITIVEAQTGVDHDYWVERIHHRISDGGYLHVAEFGCEKVVSTQYAVWDTAIWGVSVWGY